MTNNFSNTQYENPEEIAKNYIIKNYKDIKEVVIDETEDSPMGGIFVNGKANGIGFTVTMNANNNGDLSFSGIAKEEGFPRH